MKFTCAEDPEHVLKANVSAVDVEAIINVLSEERAILLREELRYASSSEHFHSLAHYGMELVKDEIKQGTVSLILRNILLIYPDLVERIERKHTQCRSKVS